MLFEFSNKTKTENVKELYRMFLYNCNTWPNLNVYINQAYCIFSQHLRFVIVWTINYLRSFRVNIISKWSLLKLPVQVSGYVIALRVFTTGKQSYTLPNSAVLTWLEKQCLPWGYRLHWFYCAESISWKLSSILWVYDANINIGMV